jgi:hypothetical protein
MPVDPSVWRNLHEKKFKVYRRSGGRGTLKNFFSLTPGQLGLETPAVQVQDGSNPHPGFVVQVTHDEYDRFMKRFPGKKGGRPSKADDFWLSLVTALPKYEGQKKQLLKDIEIAATRREVQLSASYIEKEVLRIERLLGRGLTR